MEQTTSEIAKAFVAAQKEFEKTGLDSKNPHFRNDYASLAACIGAVKEALNENGIALVQKTHECDICFNTLNLQACTVEMQPWFFLLTIYPRR